MVEAAQGRFQLFSPLSDERYAALKADIRLNGVQVPVELDQHGQVLDGHHRLRAWGELRAEGVDLDDYPRAIRSFADDDEREEHAAKVNCARRDVSLDDKQRNALRWKQHEWSNGRIADALGVAESTVRYWLGKAEATSQSCEVVLPERSIGKDGKSRPARRPRPAAFATTAAEHAKAQATLQTLYPGDVDAPSDPFDWATGEYLPVTQLRQAVAQHDREARLESFRDVPLPDGTYRCLVIDPPWPMEKIVRDARPDQGRSLDYPTMDLADIAALPVGDLAHGDGCHLYLWVTHRFLPDGLAVLERWGFRYQCLLTWVKPNGFTPWSWQYNTEHILFGRRGALDLLRRGLKLSVVADRPRHSAKPDAFYERVVEASPGPRLDLFARQPREGFLVWGNEVAP